MPRRSAGTALLRQGREAGAELLGTFGAHVEVFGRPARRLGVCIYTAARVGAIARLRRGDLEHDGSQWCLRFAEKGGKARSIPVRHDWSSSFWPT